MAQRDQSQPVCSSIAFKRANYGIHHSRFLHFGGIFGKTLGRIWVLADGLEDWATLEYIGSDQRVNIVWNGTYCRTHCCPGTQFHSARSTRLAWPKKMSKKKKTTKTVVCSSGGIEPALGKAVLRVADFDGAPVAGSYQADEAQQVGEGPGHVGGVVTTRKVPSTDLRIRRRKPSFMLSQTFKRTQSRNRCSGWFVIIQCQVKVTVSKICLSCIFHYSHLRNHCIYWWMNWYRNCLLSWQLTHGFWVSFTHRGHFEIHTLWTIIPLSYYERLRFLYD